jgi:hypothetical protein
MLSPKNRVDFITVWFVLFLVSGPVMLYGWRKSAEALQVEREIVASTGAA